MSKIFISKWFVIIVPIIVLLIGIGAGVLLGYQPIVSGETSGKVSGYVGSWTGGSVNGDISGSTGTEYIFRIETAVGYWMLALVFAITVLFICIMIRKLYINSATTAVKKVEDAGTEQ